MDFGLWTTLYHSDLSYTSRTLFHKYLNSEVINRLMEGGNQQFRITTLRKKYLFCLQNNLKQIFTYLYKTHTESAHLSKLIHCLKAMVHWLCQKLSKLLIIENLQTAATRYFAHCGWMETMMVVAVPTLHKNTAVTEAFSIHFSTNIIEMNTWKENVDITRLDEFTPCICFSWYVSICFCLKRLTLIAYQTILCLKTLFFFYVPSVHDLKGGCVCRYAYTRIISNCCILMCCIFNNNNPASTAVILMLYVGWLGQLNFVFIIFMRNSNWECRRGEEIIKQPHTGFSQKVLNAVFASMRLFSAHFNAFFPTSWKKKTALIFFMCLSNEGVYQLPSPHCYFPLPHPSLVAAMPKNVTYGEPLWKCAWENSIPKALRNQENLPLVFINGLFAAQTFHLSQHHESKKQTHRLQKLNWNPIRMPWLCSVT